MTQDSKEKEISAPIGQVSGETGLPISTIRYYEKEFGSYLQLLKTPGGHRRFRPQDIEKLKRIHHLIHTQGLSLRDAKTKLVSDRDPVLMRRDLDLLLEVFETLVRENIKIHRAIEELTARPLVLEEQAKKKKFKLLGMIRRRATQPSPDFMSWPASARMPPGMEWRFCPAHHL